MKKIISITFTILLLFVAAGTYGCNKEEIVEDFVCKFYDKTNTVDIHGLSEEGKEKEIIVVPEKINGYDVDSLGIKNFFIDKSAPDFLSDKLVKIYFVKNLNSRFSFLEIENLEKVFIIENNTENSLIGEFWTESITAPQLYMSTEIYKNYEGSVRILPANVAYFYNYENAPNDGYYWIDDLENGEKITYLPENPTREGYLFGGWFKDEACTEVWDFEKDTIIKPAEGFYENKIYAKWNKKNT